ncbi:MAG TPA: hypothetical protein VER33_23030 [Polyangiaceae bacterium]|nr:hypothetical protein [Polyangiaceae bacterium]
MHNQSWTLLLAATTQMFACSGGDKVDLGDDDKTPSASLGSSLSDYAGSWAGYVEAFQFADSTDRIRVVLDANGAGHMEAGDDAPPLPEPDANEFPPGWIQEQPGAPQPSAGYMVPGYEYPVVNARVASLRIQLETGTLEMFRGWCELQTPVLETFTSTPEQQSYGCHDNGGYAVEDGKCYLAPPPEGEIPCGKLACQYLCSCTATACSIFDGVVDIKLDAALAVGGRELTGTLVVPGGERVNVRMTRQ